MKRFDDRGYPPDVTEVAADPHRRLVVKILVESGQDPIEFESLVERLLAKERTALENPSGSKEQLRVHLYHIHLPKMNAANLIDWDQRSKMIRFNPSRSVEAAVHDLLEAFY